MTAGIFDIIIEQGATFTRTISVKDASDVAINLSTVTAVRGQVRKNAAATESFAFTLAVTNAARSRLPWHARRASADPRGAESPQW